MKQFKLKEYLANPNRKVVTRDGRPVRIICTDCRTAQPIVAIVNEGNSGMMVVTYWMDGRYISKISEDDLDLFFAPTIVKRWGIASRDSKLLFDTREEAEKYLAEKASKYEKKLCSVCLVRWEE